MAVCEPLVDVCVFVVAPDDVTSDTADSMLNNTMIKASISNAGFNFDISISSTLTLFL